MDNLLLVRIPDPCASIVKNLYAEIDNIKDTYDLSEDEVQVIDEINKDLISVKDSFKLINDRTLSRVMPYSKLSNECELVAVNLSKVEDKLEKYDMLRIKKDLTK